MKRGATISKREFLQRSAAIAAAELIGVPPEMGLRDTWAVGFRWVSQRCKQCKVGCKLSVGMLNGEAIAVRGDKASGSGGVLCFEASKILDQGVITAKAHSPQKHATCLAGVAVKTVPGRARDVVFRIIRLDGLQIIGIDIRNGVAAVWEQLSFASLEHSFQCALADVDIERLLPVFFGCY